MVWEPSLVRLQSTNSPVNNMSDNTTDTVYMYIPAFIIPVYISGAACMYSFDGKRYDIMQDGSLHSVLCLVLEICN